MTTVTFHRRTKKTGRVKPRTGRTSVSAVDVIAASVVVIRPVCVSVALVAAAVTWSSHARADTGDSGAPVLDRIGIGNNGSVSSALAEVGTSICPMLVKPGSAFASDATQLSGHDGLAPPIAGWLAGMAIQSQCPAFMTAMANGDFSMLNGVAGPAASVLGVPGGNPLIPGELGLPGR